ncbi:MAG TPA: hypothetical protein VMP67_06005 [Candidatus Limnocylindria bacterium]|nr:hypothetical protein [Candidatus Limnocylindria bacterium]
MLQRIAPFVMAAILGGCVSVGPSGESATPSSPEPFRLPSGLPAEAPDFEPPTADSATARAVGSLGDDGLLEKDAALRLFASSFGDLPGVDAQRDDRTGRSGSFAIRSVLGHWDELTAEQQAAIESTLALPPDAVVLEIPADDESVVPPAYFAAVGVADHPYTQELQEAIRSAGRTIRQMIATRMGSDVPDPLNIAIASCEPYLGCANSLWASPAGPSLSGSGAYAGCNVRITRRALAGGAPWIVSTLAHEIFHCFQGHGYGSLERAARAPAWVIEGGAEWVQNDITGDLSPTDFLMQDWFLSPGTSLMKRAYDAAGFWAHLAETGTNPYDVFPFVFLTGDGPSAFRGSGAADNQHFLNSWASSITLKEEFGRDWEMVTPGMPDLPANPELWEVANNSSVEIHAEPYTARIFRLQVSADVLAVTGSGHGRISDGRIDTFGFPAEFCTRVGGCELEDPPECPGAPPPPERIPPAPLGNEPWFVLTGGVTGATFTLVGKRLEQEEPECETPEPTPVQFCTLYRALLDWGAQHVDTDFELSQPWAAEITRRMQEMRPYAPAHLVDHVDLYIRVYGRYATVSEPYNVPIVGPEAAGIADAMRAMHTYCDISF